jgi:transposase
MHLGVPGRHPDAGGSGRCGAALPGGPPIVHAYTLTQAVLALVRGRRGEALEAWIAQAPQSGIDALGRFARGLQEDLAAVTAGLTLSWRQGPVEGQITRLKWLKRQRYGRAGFAL